MTLLREAIKNVKNRDDTNARYQKFKDDHVVTDRAIYSSWEKLSEVSLTQLKSPGNYEMTVIVTIEGKPQFKHINCGLSLSCQEQVADTNRCFGIQDRTYKYIRTLEGRSDNYPAAIVARDEGIRLDDVYFRYCKNNNLAFVKLEERLRQKRTGTLGKYNFLGKKKKSV
tara:strand:- start:78 stop:584 length:507 start_codon:yes stop_codon:yes gene_type:complete